jgi:hypothetical protein
LQERKEQGEIMLKTLLSATVALAAIVAATPATAALVTVNSTITGSAGAWVHDFTVVNNLPNTNRIYFFGVSLPTGRNIAGSPPAYDPNTWLTWDNQPYGGSATIYNNIWIDLSLGNLPPGSSLSGFKALDTGAVAATNIPFFVFAIGGNYTGPECINCGGNPGFEGLVNGGTVRDVVPEPSSWAMLIAGFGLTGAAMRRRRRSVAVA